MGGIHDVFGYVLGGNVYVLYMGFQQKFSPIGVYCYYQEYIAQCKISLMLTPDTAGTYWEGSEFDRGEKHVDVPPDS